jgi:hypothetical protein
VSWHDGSFLVIGVILFCYFVASWALLLAVHLKVPSTLTAVRALYECANGAESQLSNELFVQWTRELVDSMTMHSAGEEALYGNYASPLSCARKHQT